MDRRPHPTTVVRWMVDVAIIVLVALVLLGVGLGRLVPLTGRQTLIIGGPSMEPTLPMGSVVVVEPYAASGPSVGDIVTVRIGPKSSFVTHRVVRLLSLSGLPYVETQGDANPTPDPATIPASAVVGRMAWSLPFAGYLLALLSVPVGIAFVLALGMSLFLAAFLLDTFEPIRPVSPAGRPADSVAAGSDAEPVARSVERSPLAVPGSGTEMSAGIVLEGRVARHLTSRPPRARRRRPV